MGSVVDARFSTLERKLDFLEASLEHCDPSKRGAKPSQFKASIFDPEIRAKLIAQNAQKRKEKQRLFNKIVVAPNKSLVSKPIINAARSSPKRKPQQPPQQNIAAINNDKQPKQPKQPQQPPPVPVVAASQQKPPPIPQIVQQ